MTPVNARPATARPGLSLGLLLVAWVAFLAPLSSLRPLAAQQATSGGLTVKVHWTRDSTVNPAVSLCSATGAVGGYALVHIAFNAPDGLYSATLKELRIREDAGHYPEYVTTDVALDPYYNSFGAHVACGDPDPYQPGAPRMLYYDQMWPTTAGHNGPHTLTAVLEYTVFTGYDPITGDYHMQTSTVSQTITVDVQNLVITSTTPANPEPIRWDPDTMSSVPLTATVEACYRADHPLRLTIFDSSQTVVKVIEGTARVGVGATTISLTWDGRTEHDPYYGGTAPKGIYLFQWEFGGQDYYQDYDTDKSTLLHATDTRSEVIDYDESSDLNTIKTSYLLMDECNPVDAASEANVRSYDPDLNPIAGLVSGGVVTNAPAELNPIWNEVMFQMRIDKPGSYTHLAAAKDKHIAKDKAHRQRWALQKGIKPLHPLADNYDIINAPLGADRNARYWQKHLAGGTAYAARANGAQGAGFIMGALPKDRLFFFYGHGSLPSGGTIFTSTTPIRAKRAQPGEAGNFLEDLDLRYVLLAVYGACFSATTDPAYGNIAAQTVAQGARTAVGFDGEGPGFNQDDPGSLHRWWANALWQALATGTDQNPSPVTIKEALDYAVLVVTERSEELFEQRNSWWTDNYEVFGDSTLKIVPAR